MSTPNEGKKVIIIGGGPAGLTAAYELNKQGIKSEVFEKDDIVGGISRTVNYKGYRFDIGGHRFFTKVKVVQDMWNEVLESEFLLRDRLSRIYYKKKFFSYPFEVKNAVFGLGIFNSIVIVLSYLKAQLMPIKPENTFEHWITNRFGYRLYKIFFKTYTEKVWGIPCSQISSEWAAQRIRGLSLFSALKNALLKKPAAKKDVIKTLINSFHYPKMGPGMMWEKVKDLVEEGLSTVHMNSGVTKIYWEGSKILSISSGGGKAVSGTDFISSMPIRELIAKLDPAPPAEITAAAGRLNYRDFITVALIIDKETIFSDNWIYIHDPAVNVGRIQNFKNWSPFMVPDPSMTCLGLEYFCFEDDKFWSMSDEKLIELAKEELEKLGFAKKSEITDGTVVRMPKAYPVYDDEYKAALNTVRGFLANISNLQLVGRNGMHKYNNQDHSMLTSILAVRNILGARYDLWKINADKDYHEEIKDQEGVSSELSQISYTQPLTPSEFAVPRTEENLVEKAIIRVFSRLDKFAFATAVGVASFLFIFLATLYLTFKGSPEIVNSMLLLNNYFIGYDISIKGAFIGGGYSFMWGFIFGWLFAYIRNLSLGLVIYNEKRKLENQSLKDLLDYI
ncbi:MAG: NAD(P)/FAD-dependent oxidoreductase [Candidatus Dadabacteria bacterium]|nr:NAD(P)/FAD-dependent oxidoreductase [Candidatus Dadabacteria bacterium]NIS09536.1 NAD(P)/FAD-dependent oxidoreductase [Candidatus Dadabacteria bacterium]NIV42748.1 NAD(P)-binding protein [Candidatus Dadabacteria bacterium]NIX16642.1 NAD(P)-binding protein [Candidatus Dadabacteria bacterium]NIY23183.1 NAD(P)-binding protein [Candidatus Dadabacteria bacterium]